MILIDVEVPSMNRVYDFSLEETVPVSMILEEIIQLVSQKAQCSLAGDRSTLVLCDVFSGRILDPGRTLMEYGIENGGKLLLL